MEFEEWRVLKEPEFLTFLLSLLTSSPLYSKEKSHSEGWPEIAAATSLLTAPELGPPIVIILPITLLCFL